MSTLQRARRTSLLSILTVSAVALPLLIASPATAADTVLASDDMSRTSAQGWGSATTGGAYTSLGRGKLSVGAGAASMVAPEPGATVGATLASVAAGDVTSRIDVALGARPTGGSTYVTHTVRDKGGKAYGARVRVAETGQLSLQIVRLQDSTATVLTDQRVPWTPAQAGATLSLSAVGTQPVVLKATITDPSATTSSLSATVNDGSASRISTAGGVGVRVYNSARGTVVPVTFDNLLATHLGCSAGARSGAGARAGPGNRAPAPAPEPAPAPAPAPAPPAGTAYVGQRGTAGAAAPGTLNYPVPAGAVFVATNGSDSNPGTAAQPLATLTRAAEVAPNYGDDRHARRLVPRIGVDPAASRTQDSAVSE